MFKMPKILLASGMVIFTITSGGIAYANDLILRQSPVALGAQVTVGDVFENAGDKAGLPLARAPIARQKLVYNSNSLQTKLNTLGLKWPNAEKVQQVTIWGKEARMDDIAANNNLANNNLAVKYPNDYKPFANAQNNNANIGINDVNNPEREIAVLNRSISRNEIITTDMISWINVNNNVAYGVINDAADLIGKTSNRNLDANTPIRTSDVSTSKAVKRGDNIILIYEIGALRISASGKSLADGFVGSRIKVVNTTSNKTLDAIVQDNGIAKVTTNNTQLSAR